MNHFIDRTMRTKLSNQIRTISLIFGCYLLGISVFAQSPETDTSFHFEQVDVKPTEGLRINEGIIQLVVPDNQYEVSSELIQQWLEEETLIFKGITVSTDDITMTEDSVISISFVHESDAFTQVAMSTISIQEQPGLENADMEVPLYLMRVNTFRIKTGGKNYEDDQQFISLSSNLTIEANTDSIDVIVKTMDGQPLHQFLAEEAISSIELIEGTYHFTFSKQGYQDAEQVVSLNRGEDATISIQLNPREMEAFAPEPTSDERENKFGTFVREKKYWILGGIGAAVISSAAILIFTDDSPKAGIPIPPGRPVAQ